ncbi:MAG TPA: hypothetical protein VES42_00545 [Pilimelia sp.]|nr:hypothetical protein [Pilimelia sp.]
MTTTATATRAPRPTGRSGKRPGYVLLSACIDGHAGPFSAPKRAVLAAVAAQRGRLGRDLAADVALLTARRITGPAVAGAAPPARRVVRVRQWATVDGHWGEVTSPPFDVAVLVRCPTAEWARWLTADPTLVDLQDTLGAAGRGCRLEVLDDVRGAAAAPDAPGAGPYLLVSHARRPRRLGGAEPAPAPVWAWPDDRSMRRDLALSPHLRRYAGDAATPSHVTWYGPV